MRIKDQSKEITVLNLDIEYPRPFGQGCMLALPIFLGRSSIVLAKKVSSGHFPPEAENEQKRNRTLSVAVIVLALSAFLGRPSIVLP